MDRSAVKAIVDREIEPLMRRLGIPHWNIVVEYEPQANRESWHRSGHCEWHVDYNKALLTLNPESFDDEGELLKTLRHELFHIVSSPFTIFWNVVKRLVADDVQKLEMLDSVWEHSNEQAVINLERMYHGLTTPEELTVAKLTSKVRKALPKSAFAEPGKRKYPMEDRVHAANAKARVAQVGTPAEKKKVDAAANRKFPGLGKPKGSKRGK